MDTLGGPAEIHHEFGVLAIGIRPDCYTDDVLLRFEPVEADSEIVKAYASANAVIVRFQDRDGVTGKGSLNIHAVGAAVKIYVLMAKNHTA
jgi:hypothetical protein